jgi:ribonuclease-3
MANLVVIFRTHSDIEASIVRGLLDSHGIHALVSSDVPHSVFPLTIDGLGEVRISVHDEDADTARRVIASHVVDEPRGGPVRLMGELEPLEKAIGYRFRDRGLLEHALTHRSRAHEDASGGVVDNESLEFLGDAVLGFVVADLLFHELPESSEGRKSKLKAALVSAPVLAQLAERLGLGDYLLLGRGEEKTGGRQKQALVADSFEALIAAIYLDGGVGATRAFIVQQYRDLIDEVHRTGAVSLLTDSKSALQEWLQSHDKPLPEYFVVGQRGPDHQKVFEVEVRSQGVRLGSAEGRSRKEAEQAAARQALGRLNQGGWGE